MWRFDCLSTQNIYRSECIGKLFSAACLKVGTSFTHQKPATEISPSIAARHGARLAPGRPRPSAGYHRSGVRRRHRARAKRANPCVGSRLVDTIRRHQKLRVSSAPVSIRNEEGARATDSVSAARRRRRKAAPYNSSRALAALAYTRRLNTKGTSPLTYRLVRVFRRGVRTSKRYTVIHFARNVTF